MHTNEEKQEAIARVVIVGMLGVMVGLGIGSMIFHLLIPQPNAATRAAVLFRISENGFKKTNLHLEKFPDTDIQRRLVAKQIMDWIMKQRDKRENGLYLQMVECTYELKTGQEKCSDGNEFDSGFFDNRSWQAPIWGMYKYYQNTGDERVLAQIEVDLRTVKRVILDHPDLYNIQNNNLSCLYLKDLYFGVELSEEGRQIIAEVCQKSEYEVLVGRLADYDYDQHISQKIEWLLAEEYDTEKLTQTYQQLKIDPETMSTLVRYDTSFLTTADMIAAEVIQPGSWAEAYLKPQMDLMLTEYAYLLNNAEVLAYHQGGLALALAYYAMFVSEDPVTQRAAMNLAQKIYNQAFQNGQMNVDELMGHIMVQYHLGFPMRQIQSELLREFYAEGSGVWGEMTPKFFPIPGTIVRDEDSVTCVGDIVRNGVLMGVLSI